MRHRVSMLEQYANITRWGAEETTDIVYQDRDSTFTRMLIDKGYLERSKWQGLSPTYGIEVKTTIHSLEEPFYCSQKQVDLMESMELDNEPSSQVYIVARVFKLAASGIGLKLYLDPTSLRKQERLRFKADQYRVTPVG
jgi:hypothetical protein